MRFALLGNHPDGLAMARALVESGRHQLAACTTAFSDEQSADWNRAVPRAYDLEEILADPAIEAVLVASPAAARPFHLRRALQSERHVLCVHPADQTPEIAYEAAMIRNDTRCVLFPLLPRRLHPAVERLRELLHRPGAADSAVGGPSPGTLQLLELAESAGGDVLENVDQPNHKPSFPIWDLLRSLSGEIVEVSAFAAEEEVLPGAPVLAAGRFERGGLFQVTLLPNQPRSCCRLSVLATWGKAVLVLSEGWPGPAQLEVSEVNESPRGTSWAHYDPWPALVEQFEAAVEANNTGAPFKGIDWQDAVRSLELDDAARRSIERRRSSLLEYQEASEEVGFKGTMTLIGCAMVWVIILLLILSVWVPWVGWLIAPLLVVFLGLQLLRWVIPDKVKAKD
jgi:predicted dehydrogenase